MSKGSEWRIWDLHVHTPHSYGGDYGDFISKAADSVASVIGLNDYFSVDGYKAVQDRGGIPGKVIFPVVEFRMNNILESKHSKSSVRINFHIIFDNDPKVFGRIATFVSSLLVATDSGKSVQLGSVQEYKSLSVNFNDVVKSLRDLELYGTHALIWLPYDEYGGIDEIDPISDAFFKAKLINDTHFLGSSNPKQIAFFKWEDRKHPEEKYREWIGRRFACIKGSDAHSIDYPVGSLMDADSKPTQKFCWLNADTTFAGLKQVLAEPDRCYIGKQPDLLTRVTDEPTKFIRSIAISKNDGSALNESWFDGVSLELNSALVAIIGNKGSGKSALSDVLAICGNTHRSNENFSFLTDSKFKKHPANRAEHFSATLTWMDGSFSQKRLSDGTNPFAPERVRYLPQSFLEHICSNVESKEFETEIKKIVFAHIAEEKRFDQRTLDDLIEYLSQQTWGRIRSLQTEISAFNLELVELEAKTADSYRKKIVGQLELKKVELQALVNNRPLPPVRPAGDEPITDAEIARVRIQLAELETEIESHRERLKILTKDRQDLLFAKESLDVLADELRKRTLATDPMVQILNANGISISDVFSFQIVTEPITQVTDGLDTQIKQITSELDAGNRASSAFRLASLTLEYREMLERLAIPQREHQEYLERVDSWTQKKAQLEGPVTSPGTLAFLQAELEYLDTNLRADIEATKERRNGVFEELFHEKLSLKRMREELFAPVTQFIGEIEELHADYDVGLNVVFDLTSFSDEFLDFINHARAGSFYGREEARERIKRLIDTSDFNSWSGIAAFADELMTMLTRDYRFENLTQQSVSDQLRQNKTVEQLYDFIYHLDYLEPIYELKLDQKSLSELSPGERGALLLIFYLVLDTDDIPLIIDQPEDNLDNESIYRVLVRFIKQVKKRRQVIIVTHNANLAIVCDAEQLVRAKINKSMGSRVTYVSGAIEDSEINRAGVDVLEGTIPAFDNRNAKWMR